MAERRPGEQQKLAWFLRYRLRRSTRHRTGVMAARNACYRLTQPPCESTHEQQ
jgi:hypothetical protein